MNQENNTSKSKQQFKYAPEDPMEKIIRSVMLILSKLFDKLFGTRTQENFKPPVVPIKQNNHKQQEQKSFSISEAKEIDHDIEKSNEDDLLTIKDILRGDHSVNDLAEQQDRLAQEGHAVFKQTAQDKSMAR